MAIFSALFLTGSEEHQAPGDLPKYEYVVPIPKSPGGEMVKIEI